MSDTEGKDLWSELSSALKGLDGDEDIGLKELKDKIAEHVQGLQEVGTISLGDGKPMIIGLTIPSDILGYIRHKLADDVVAEIDGFKVDYPSMLERYDKLLSWAKGEANIKSPSKLPQNDWYCGKWYWPLGVALSHIIADTVESAITKAIGDQVKDEKDTKCSNPDCVVHSGNGSGDNPWQAYEAPDLE